MIWIAILKLRDPGPLCTSKMMKADGNQIQASYEELYVTLEDFLSFSHCRGHLQFNPDSVPPLMMLEYRLIPAPQQNTSE